MSVNQFLVMKTNFRESQIGYIKTTLRHITQKRYENFRHIKGLYELLSIFYKAPTRKFLIESKKCYTQ